MSNPAIETADLTKTYGHTLAVDRASLRLDAGEILGFVGPNGAGKSTFMKLLLGVARPTSGSGRVLGLDIVRESEAIRRLVGYLPGDLGFYRALRGGAFLDFCLSFYRTADRTRARQLADLFQLPLRQKIKGYSSGMRQKLGLIQALSVGARLLILDEPTKGLDPTSQSQFLDLLTEEQQNGSTILLSSHVLEEIERVCTRIDFIDHGRIVAPETIQKIRGQFRRTLRVSFTEGHEPNLSELPGIAEIHRENSGYLLHVDGPIGPVLERLAALDIESMEYNRPSLQEIYRAIYLSGERT